ncbi:MAG TPA: hypothetical protein VFF69_01420 [Phycisphaerales bacterium]|nr:hypothetical protein [Phycisphaerales bacterium]
MRWHTHDPFDLPSRGEMARRLHSEWLTWALGADDRFPRIPRQAVRDGGYESLLATPRGRRVCERWWRRALAVVDRLTPERLR